MNNNIYEKHVMADTRLPFILHKTHYPPNYGDAGFGNWHENLEMLFIRSGTGKIFLDGTPVNVKKDDIVVIGTNCVHRICSIEAMDYYCLIVDRSFCLSNHFDTNDINFKPTVRDAEIFGLIERFVSEYDSVSDDNFGVQMVRSTALRIVALLCRRHTLPNAVPKEDSHLMSCIKQAIGYINANSSKDISLEDISEFVGLSKFYFAREFKRITHHTFVSYVNMVRCEQAKSMLSETHDSIGEISRKCGFSNQSYFTRVFRAYTGMLPAQYRNN